jgi:AAA domain-containing protein
MALRGLKPEAVAKRLKAFWFGDAGSRKTTTAIQFPTPYLIDSERGATNDQYVKALKAVGGAYVGPEQGSTDLDEIITEVSALLSDKHSYRTLIIDPITISYADACDKAAREIAAREGKGDGTEFGRNKAIADRKMKRLCALLLRLDMNVILTSHAKIKWVKDGTGFREDGRTFDAYGKLDYLFDLVIETQLRGTEGWAIVRKSRIEAFPMFDTFPLSYDTVADRYGRAILERTAEPVKLASSEQVSKLEHLVSLLKVEPELVQKWLDKAEAVTFAEMPAAAASKCIGYLEDKISNLPTEKEAVSA